MEDGPRELDAPCIDGSKDLPDVQMVRDEVYDPKDPTNAQTDALTKTALEVWCKGMLQTLTEGEGAKYVKGGKYGVDNQTETMKEHFRGTYRNTDKPCESYFGLLKFIKGSFANLSIESANAMAMARRNHLFDIVGPSLVPHKPRKPQARAASKVHKKKRPVKVATKGKLAMRREKSNTVAAALLATARRNVGVGKKRKAADISEASAHNLQKRKADIQKKLDDQVKQFIAAEKSFEIPAIADATALSVQLGVLATSKQRAACCKRQIKRLVEGCGLAEFKVKYTSKNGAEGEEGTEANYNHLKRSLLKIYQAIETNGIVLPDEAAMPPVKRRLVPKVGTMTTQRAEIEGKEVRTADEVKAAAIEMKAAAPSRSSGSASARRSASSAPAARSAPVIDSSLVNKAIEVTFEMTYGRGKSKITGLFGCPGKIARVSDEKTTPQRKKIGLGWAYINFTDGSDDWQLLRPNFFEKHRPGGWRIINENDLTLDANYEFEDASDGGSGSDDDNSDGQRIDSSDSEDD